MERINEVKDILRQERENRLKNVLLRFDTMKPFRDSRDVPPIPVIDKTLYEEHIIPNLIRCGAIPKDRLEEGVIYEGDCRNAHKARWNGKRFVYLRTKFGCTYPEEINHFEDDDGYDVFVPIKKTEDKELE